MILKAHTICTNDAWTLIMLTRFGTAWRGAPPRISISGEHHAAGFAHRFTQQLGQ